MGKGPTLLEAEINKIALQGNLESLKETLTEYKDLMLTLVREFSLHLRNGPRIKVFSQGIVRSENGE